MQFASDVRLRFIRRTTVGIATLGVLTSLAVAPAFAADEEIDFTINAGALELVTKTATSFAAVDFQLSGTPATTDSDYVYTVTDETGDLADGWTVSVVGEALTATEGNIPVGNIVLTNVGVDSTAGDDETGVLNAAPVTMSTTEQQILSAEGADGDGAYDHTVNIEVTVPNMTAAGNYSGTLTFTVAPQTAP